MLITRISGCKGKTFLLNRKDLDEIKYNFYKRWTDIVLIARKIIYLQQLQFN